GFGGVRRAQDSGGVDQYVKAAECFDRCGDTGSHGSLVGDVDHQGGEPVVRFGVVGGIRSRGEPGIALVGRDDVSSFREHSGDRGLSDAGSRAGDQYSASLIALHVSLLRISFLTTRYATMAHCASTAYRA